MKLHPRLRRFARDFSRIGSVVAAVMFVSTVAQALPSGAPPAGAMVLNPSTGDSGTSISMTFASTPQFCPGDAVASFRWTTFIVPRSTDVASMTFSPSGNPQGPAFSSALRTAVPGGVLVRAQNPGLGDGIVIPPLAIDFANVGFAALTPGDYWMGIACTKSDGTVVQNEKYWTVPVKITASEGAGPNNFTYAVDTVADTTTSTSTTVADSTTTTTTTVAGSTTTTTVAGGTTTTTVAGATTTVAGGTSGATVSPSTPTPGGSYRVTFPNCSVGETITFSQSASTPSSVTDVCEASSALTSGSIAGIRMPAQATTGTATGSFTAAPTAPGSYTVTMTGTVSAQRTVTFVIVGASTPVTGGNSNVNTGGSTSGNTSGTIPSTGSSTTSLIVWGVLLLVFGRMAILLGRKPKVLTGT